MRSFKRSKRRGNPVVQLTLTSLMDIFTILLLFLLVHMGEEAVALPASDQLDLPISSSKISPESTLVLMVTTQDIFLEGHQLMSVDDALKENEVVLLPVKEELDRLAKRSRFLSSQNKAITFSGRITVMGDKKIPFRLLKKIMQTCAQAGYGEVSLGVIKKEA